MWSLRRTVGKKSRPAPLSLSVEVLEDRALPAPFTAGNLVIYRVGDGSTPLVNTGSVVVLDEYTPSGTRVQSIVLPTTASGSNKPLVASGTANSEGLLTRSADGRYLLLTGYGSTIPAGSSCPEQPQQQCRAWLVAWTPPGPLTLRPR